MALLVLFSTAVFSQGTFEKLLKQGNLHVGYLTIECPLNDQTTNP